MPVVIAAKQSNTKNKVPNKELKGICPNATGMVTKISPGPLPGSSPEANTTGKMARPASKATMVSATAIVPAARGMDTSLGN